MAWWLRAKGKYVKKSVQAGLIREEKTAGTRTWTATSTFQCQTGNLCQAAW